MANDQIQKKVPVKIKTRVFRDSPEAFFRAGFERIANTRMKGVPILNPKLHVSSVPFKKVNGQWVGGIVTPWSILVIRACGDPLPGKSFRKRRSAVLNSRAVTSASWVCLILTSAVTRAVRSSPRPGKSVIRPQERQSPGFRSTRC